MFIIRKDTHKTQKQATPHTHEHRFQEGGPRNYIVLFFLPQLSVKLIVRNTGKQCFGKGKGMKRKKDRKVDGFTIMEVDFFSSHAIDIVSVVVGGFFILTHSHCATFQKPFHSFSEKFCLYTHLSYIPCSTPLKYLMRNKENKQLVTVVVPDVFVIMRVQAAREELELGFGLLLLSLSLLGFSPPPRIS